MSCTARGAERSHVLTVALSGSSYLACGYLGFWGVVLLCSMDSPEVQHAGLLIYISLKYMSIDSGKENVANVAVAAVSITKQDTDTSTTSSSTTTPPSTVPAIDSSLDQAILQQQQTSSGASCISATTTCPTKVSGVQHSPNNDFDVWTSPHFKCGGVPV